MLRVVCSYPKLSEVVNCVNSVVLPIIKMKDLGNLATGESLR